MIVNGYATLDEAKTWVGISDAIDDGLLDDVINGVSRGIDLHCGRHFWRTTSVLARQFDSEDGLCLDIDDLSTVTGLIVKTDDNQDGTFETTWAASDYQLLPVNVLRPEPRPYTQILAVGSRRWPTPTTRYGLVQITGTWGWPADPAALKQACRMQTSRILQRRKSPEGVAGFGDFGLVRVGADDLDVRRLLQPYVIHAVA